MDHRQYLLAALTLAEKRRGFCCPNPSVGAVIVQGKEIVGQGYHEEVGLPHAEVMALQDLASTSSEQLTLYVTLEPCCHWGKTPPCTDLIIQSGIKSVFYAFQDPNPEVAGRGEQRLREHGVLCQKIPLDEIDKFYQSYQHWTKTKRPFVTAKLAMSLDAKIAGANDKRVQITGTQAQIYTHQGRLRADAMLTSVKTILQDDPALNVRLENAVFSKPIYILDRELRLPLQAQVFKTAKCIHVFHSNDNPHKIADLQTAGVICHRVREDVNGLDLLEVMTKIGEDGIHDLWVEAGGKIYSALIRQKLVHKALLYIAPTLLGSTASAAFHEELDLSNSKTLTWNRQGDDIICELNL